MPYVTTPQNVVDAMLELAGIGPSDILLDLGSGDGRVVITAAQRFGTRGTGIELDPRLIALARAGANAAGVGARATFLEQDLFATDLASASVITLYLLPAVNLKLRAALQGLKPGTRIVSNTFTMAEWEPDEKVDLNGQPGCESSYCTVLFWVVPRRVAGTYSVAQGQVTLKQNFQRLTGTLKTGDTSVALKGRVRGETIELVAGDKQYRGRLNGRSLELRDAG